jgi:hypothetical protein
MRTVQWLYLVSVLLFISGIGFVIAGARSARAATPAPEAPATTPIASIKQIMNGIVLPDATIIYNAVGTVSTVKGVEETAPETDEDWAKVANSAAAVIESGNLMLMGERAITRDFMEQGKLALKAAEAKDKDGIVSAGGDLNTTCDNCHARYQRQ